MKKTNGEKIARKIRFLMTLTSICTVLLLLLAVFLCNNKVVIVLIAAAVAMASFVSRWVILKKLLLPSLVSDFDPYTYSEIIEKGKLMSKELSETIQAAFYTGDYAKCAELCVFCLKNKKLKRFKCYYLSYLARIYFQNGDKEKLQKVADCYLAEVERGKVSDSNRKKYSFLEMCSVYVKDPAAALELYESYLLEKRFTATKWQEVHTRFTYAVLCYENGKNDSAAENFGFVANTANLLPFADISKKYLECIENNTNYIALTEEVLPGGNLNAEFYKKRTKKRAVTCAGAVLLYVLLVAAFVTKALWAQKDYRVEYTAFVEKVGLAILEHYDEFVFEDCVNVNVDGNYMGAMCIFSTDDGLCAGMIFTYKGEDEYHIDSVVTNIEFGKSFSMDCYYSTLEAVIVENKNDIPDYVRKTVDVKIGGKKHILGLIW